MTKQPDESTAPSVVEEVVALLAEHESTSYAGQGIPGACWTVCSCGWYGVHGTFRAHQADFLNRSGLLRSEPDGTVSEVE